MNELPSPVFDEAAFATLFDGNLAEFHTAWSVFLLRYSASLRAALGGVDDAILLVALSMASVMKGAPTDASAGFDVANGPYAGKEPPPTNAVRLAEMTGMPRETVRRRLTAMAKLGWVEQSGPPRREWRLVVGPGGWPRVAQEMAAVHREFLGEMARLLSRWDRAAQEAGWEALTRPPRHGRAAAAPPAASRGNGAPRR